MEAEKDYTVKDDMICPITKLHCDDECCPVGSTCNMSNIDILNYESPSMENLQIKIVITDGEKEAKTSINIKDYQAMKELHGVSLVDMQVDALLNETFGGNNE